MTPNCLEHEVNNAALGVALELKRITESLTRIQVHMKRMTVACEKAEAEAECYERDQR